MEKKLNLRKVVGVSVEEYKSEKSNYNTWNVLLDNGMRYKTQTCTLEMIELRKNVYLNKIYPIH